MIVADLCAGVTCRHGARCEHGRCVCPQQCPSKTPGETVCGSDGQTYRSECHMRLAACQRSEDIDVVSRAPCEHDDLTHGSGDGRSTHTYLRDLPCAASLADHPASKA